MLLVIGPIILSMNDGSATLTKSVGGLLVLHPHPEPVFPILKIPSFRVGVVLSRGKVARPHRRKWNVLHTLITIIMAGTPVLFLYGSEDFPALLTSALISEVKSRAKLGGPCPEGI